MPRAADGPGPSTPGAPQGPVPWSRRWPAVAAGREPAGRDRRRGSGGWPPGGRRRSAVSSAASRKRSEVLARGEAGRAAGPLGAEREPVGDGGAGRERGGRVVGARPSRATKASVGIGDEERGVVGLLVRGVGDAALPARVEQAGHDVDRLVGAAGPLEPEADQVHADQRRLAPPRRRGSCAHAHCRWRRRAR